MSFRNIFIIITIISLYLSCAQKQNEYRRVKPVIEGEWWQIAGNPDLGELSSERQQPVDFGIWQADDGTWQLWSCIRNTKEMGKTRLFHRWEAKSLFDRNWEPKGVAMRADTSLAEHPGGMQAPYVIKDQNKYLMFYGDWNRICLAESEDGKSFHRVVNDGSPSLFGDSVEINTRDAMVLKQDDAWFCYYTAHPGMDGKVFVRTSDDLENWSESTIVSYGGQAGKGKFWLAECPFVVEQDNGQYYLYRTQSYGTGDGPAKTSIYHSDDLMNFGIENDSGFVGTLEVAAPEIFNFKNQWYIAALMPNLDGIRIAKLSWVPVD